MVSRLADNDFNMEACIMTWFTRLFNFVVARAVPPMLATVGANGYG
jgi:hypothetical protein